MPITQEQLESIPGGMGLGITDSGGRKWEVLYREIIAGVVVVRLFTPDTAGYPPKIRIAHNGEQIHYCLIGPRDIDFVVPINELNDDRAYTDAVPKVLAKYVSRWKAEAQNISLKVSS